MKSTGRITHEAPQTELLDDLMEQEIEKQKSYLSDLDYQLEYSTLSGNRRKEVLKSMINYLVEQL